MNGSEGVVEDGVPVWGGWLVGLEFTRHVGRKARGA